MTHTFLLESGQWTVKGFWCDRGFDPCPLEGRVNILWNQPNWFCWSNTLILSEQEKFSPQKSYLATSELTFTYKGYLTSEQSQYTFVLKHNILGNLEGDGWITPHAIIQRYWVLNDRKRRQGFDTLYREAEDTYRLCSSLSQGHQMMTTLEATLSRSS